MSKKQKISKSDGKKVNKYLCAFNNKWLNEENCKQWLKKVDEKTANCTLCNSNFTIIYDGFLAIEKHMRNASHVKNSKLILRQNTINNFFVKKDTKEENKVILTEVAFIYHSIKHNHSYLSMECGMKLSPKLFPDSHISKKN